MSKLTRTAIMVISHLVIVVKPILPIFLSMWVAIRKCISIRLTSVQSQATSPYPYRTQLAAALSLSSSTFPRTSQEFATLSVAPFLKEPVYGLRRVVPLRLVCTASDSAQPEAKFGPEEQES